jgi:hypothetical protein
MKTWNLTYILAGLCSRDVMCFLWSTNWNFIPQKTTFFIVAAVKPMNTTLVMFSCHVAGYLKGLQFVCISELYNKERNTKTITSRLPLSNSSQKFTATLREWTLLRHSSSFSWNWRKSWHMSVWKALSPWIDPVTSGKQSLTNRQTNKQTPWPLVRERTIPTERPPLVDEI